MKKIFFTVIIVFLVFSCNKKNNSETEPNDKMSQANPIEIGKTYTGKLETESDIDNYYYKTGSNEVLSISLSGLKGVNHAVKIWKIVNSNPVAIKLIDDNRKSSPENFANLSVDPGEYIFSIIHGMKDQKKGNSESFYEFTVNSMVIQNDEHEPNDSADNACRISPGEKRGGFFSPGLNFLNSRDKDFKEEDWYFFDIEGDVKVPLIVSAEISSVPSVDSVLLLYDEKFNEIYRADLNITGSGEKIPDMTLKSTGRYYLVVYSKNYLSNTMNPYEITMNLKSPETGREMEPNDSPEKANIIENDFISGTVLSQNDKDFFRLNLQTNKLKKIILKGGVGTGIRLEQIRSGEVISKFDKTESDMSLLIPNIMIYPGDNFKITGSFSSGKVNSYELAFSDISVEGNMEIENNDNIEKSNILRDDITGFISREGDIDYFKMLSDKKVKYEITVVGVKDGKLSVSTTDSLGFIISTIEIDGDKTARFIELINQKGYLVVEAKSRTSENPYKITLKEIK